MKKEFIWYMNIILKESLLSKEEEIRLLKEKLENTEIDFTILKKDDEFPEGVSEINPDCITKEDAILLKECLFIIFKKKNEVIVHYSFVDAISGITDFLKEDFETELERLEQFSKKE